MTFFSNLSTLEGSVAGFAGGIAEGMDVQTPCGPRRIERLRPGDMVVTRQGLQAVRLVWERMITRTEVQMRPALAPVRLKPRVLGPLTPRRDLVVAGDQLLLVPGHRLHGFADAGCCLVPASEIAGTSDSAHIDWPSEPLRVFTLIFDAPQVFSVHGMLVESYVPAGPRLSDLPPEPQSDLFRRFPQLRREPAAYPPRLHPVIDQVEFLPI